MSSLITSLQIRQSNNIRHPKEKEKEGVGWYLNKLILIIERRRPTGRPLTLILTYIGTDHNVTTRKLFRLYSILDWTTLIFEWYL
jgi:hypothetical protein